MSYIGKSPPVGVRTRFYYTSTGGETSLSGADDNGAVLAFSDGAYVDVLLNGITLVAGVDYNTNTGNTISGLAALTSGDVAEIVVYDVFSLVDTVSKSNGGTFDGIVTFGGGANGTIGGTTPATGTFTTLVATGTAVAKQGMPIVTETGTTKTFALTDTGSYVRTTSGSAVTITVPANSSVAFPIGAEIVVFQAGAGQVTFVAGSGVTINSKDNNLKILGQYSSATLKKIATDEWDMIGDLDT